MNIRQIIERSRLGILLVYLISALTVSAALKVYNVSGKVSIIRNGKFSPLAKGVQLRADDKLDLGSGASLDVINENNGVIYSSTERGLMNVSELMLKASKRSADNTGSVNSQIRYTKSPRKNSGSRVYVETGMVKRSFGDNDIAGQDMWIDTELLGAYLKNLLRGGTYPDNLPIPVSAVCDNGNLKGYRLDNILDIPLYFNVISVEKEGMVTLSVIGDPSGCYVLLPQQSISRENFKSISGTDEIIIVSNYRFDMERLLEILNNVNEGQTTESDMELPVYVQKLSCMNKTR